MRDQYYWTSLAMDAFGWVAACPTCATNRLVGTQKKAYMRLFPATETFAELAIDLIGPLPRTPKDMNISSLFVTDLLRSLWRSRFETYRLWMFSAHFSTRGLLAMGSPIQFYRITDPKSLPYSGMGCSRFWVLTLTMPPLTTAHLKGRSHELIRPY